MDTWWGRCRLPGRNLQLWAYNGTHWAEKGTKGHAGIGRVHSGWSLHHALLSPAFLARVEATQASSLKAARLGSICKPRLS